jgi:hypothetical protein
LDYTGDVGNSLASALTARRVFANVSFELTVRFSLANELDVLSAEENSVLNEVDRESVQPVLQRTGRPVCRYQH